MPGTGYPFLHLARLYGVGYGDVLTVADWMGYDALVPPWASPVRLRQALRNVSHALLLDIEALVALPVAKRGGPH